MNQPVNQQFYTVSSSTDENLSTFYTSYDDGHNGETVDLRGVVKFDISSVRNMGIDLDTDLMSVTLRLYPTNTRAIRLYTYLMGTVTPGIYESDYNNYTQTIDILYETDPTPAQTPYDIDITNYINFNNDYIGFIVKQVTGGPYGYNYYGMSSELYSPVIILEYNNPVPEPTTMILISMALSVFFARKKNHR